MLLFFPSLPFPSLLFSSLLFSLHPSNYLLLYRLVWEVLTRQPPFGDMDNVNVILAVCGGLRLDIPKNCPPQLADLLVQCWSLEPEDRPTFEQIYQELLTIENNS